MKNIILGIAGGMIILYTVMIAAALYRIGTAENALEYCLSSSMVSVMQHYYETGESSAAQAELIAHLQEELALVNDADLKITVKACDMEKGILSVEAEETLALPGGLEKTISASRTLIVDREDPDYKNSAADKEDRTRTGQDEEGENAAEGESAAEEEGSAEGKIAADEEGADEE